MMEFLYFPEDKTEYIPALFSLMLFVVIAVLVMRLIMKKARHEQEQFENKYPEAKRDDHKPR